MFFHVDGFLRKGHDSAAVDELNKNVAKAFGEKLAESRDKAGLTQEALAYRSSVHRTVIGQLELGHNCPRLDTLIKLAGALGIEPCELMADIRWTPPPAGPSSGGFSRI